MERTDPVTFVKEQKQIIVDHLDSLPQISDELIKKQKIDEIFLIAEQLKRYVHQHSSTMISYEIGLCNNVIKEIDAKISKVRANVNNKQFKFSFKLKNSTSSEQNNSTNRSSSLKTTTKELEKENQSVDMIDSKITQKINQSDGLRDLCNEEKFLTNSEIDFKVIVLDSLKNCVIYLKGAPSTLRLINIQDCKIYSGPVSSSVFIYDCHYCQMNIAGQQLRIHNSTNCDIYQHVTSRTIIESCSKLRFGCFNWKYDQLEDDFKKAKISIYVNNWKQIDDFDCLSHRSPNWSLINE